MVLIILTSQKSFDQEKGKEKVVHKEPHDEHDEFMIDFVSFVDPVSVVQKMLCDLARRLKKLTSTGPQTPKIQQTEDELMHLVETYTVGINVIFNYKKSSRMIFIVYFLIYVIKQNTYVLFL